MEIKAWYLKQQKETEEQVKAAFKRFSLVIITVFNDKEGYLSKIVQFFFKVNITPKKTLRYFNADKWKTIAQKPMGD